MPSYDEAATVGLVLWKIRKVFADFPREYQLLVADDASTDATAELLQPYAKVLPLTVIRHDRRLGYGPSVELLLREALQRSDRPKRDCAVLMHADFSHGPEFLPELVKRFDSGADV
ncbi:MAG: glycosyltransferase family 2 protein, partial [Gemmatimonadota bacterium]